jgi:hypothetical protein
MLLKGEAPPAFSELLAVDADLARLDRNGAILRAAVPGYLARRRALLFAHAALPPPGLLDMIACYAEPSVEDLWSSELVATVAGRTRAREDGDGEDEDTMDARPSTRRRLA